MTPRVRRFRTAALVAIVAFLLLLALAPLAGAILGPKQFTFEGQFSLSDGSQVTVLALLTESAAAGLTGRAIVVESSPGPQTLIGTFGVTGSVVPNATGGPGNTFDFALNNPGPVQLTSLPAGTSFTFGLVNPGPISFVADLPGGGPVSAPGYVLRGLVPLFPPAPCQDTFAGQFVLPDESQFTVVACLSETATGQVAGHAVVVEVNPGPVNLVGTFSVQGTDKPNATGGPGSTFDFVLTKPGPIQRTSLSAGTSFTFGLVNPGPMQFSGEIPGPQPFSGAGFVLTIGGPWQVVFAGEFSAGGDQFTVFASFGGPIGPAEGALTGHAEVEEGPGPAPLHRTFRLTGSVVPNATGGPGGNFSFVLTDPGPAQQTALALVTPAQQLTGTTFWFVMTNPGPIQFSADVPGVGTASGTGFVMINPAPSQCDFEGQFSLPDGTQFTVLASLGQSRAGGLAGWAFVVESSPGPVQTNGTFSVTGLETPNATGGPGDTYTFVLANPRPSQDTSLPVGTSFTFGLVSPGPINFAADLPGGGSFSGSGYVLRDPGPVQLVFGGQFSLPDGDEFTVLAALAMNSAGKLTGHFVAVEVSPDPIQTVQGNSFSPNPDQVLEVKLGTFTGWGAAFGGPIGSPGFSFTFVLKDPGPIQDTSLPVGTTFTFGFINPGPISFGANLPKIAVTSGSGFVLIVPVPGT